MLAETTSRAKLGTDVRAATAAFPEVPRVRRLTLASITLLGALLCPAARSATAPAPDAKRPPPPASDTSNIALSNGTRAFVAWPSGRGEPGPSPAIVVVQEWWGLNAQIRDVARRLAREGYVAIVPDLYHGQVAETPEAAHELSRALDQDAALADLAAATSWLRASPRVGRRRVGVLGFCLGGGIALQFGLKSQEPAAVVMFYGAPETDPARLASLRAPLLGHFGAEDRGIPTARVDAFRDALARAGRTAEVRTYAGAGHAFMHDGLPSYHADAARQAWARTLAFLQKTLRGGS